MSAPIEIAEQYSEFLATARSVRIDGLEFHDLPLKSMIEYSTHEPVPSDFPRPEDHFVIADYLIDLPVVAVDLSRGSGDTGAVFAYAYHKYWLVADSLRDFADRLQSQHDAALWGKEDPRPNQSLQPTAGRSDA